MEKGNGNTVLLTVIGVATLLVALVGATFAYFTATVNNDSNQSVVVTTGQAVALSYRTQGQIALENVVPGTAATQTSTFTVINPAKVSDEANAADNTVNYSYDLTFKVDANGLRTNPGDELKITITQTSSVNNRKSELASGWTDKVFTDGASTAAANAQFVVVDDQTIAPGETQTYSIVVNFNDLGKGDNTNAGKSFSGHIDISDTKSVATAATNA